MASFRVPGATRLRGHGHETLHVCVALEGGFSQREGRSWRDVAANTVRVSAAATHDIDFSGGDARCLVLEAEPETDAPLLQALPRARFIQPDPWLLTIIRRIDVASAPETTDSATTIILDSLATELLAQLERRMSGNSAPPPPWLQHVREHLHDTAGATPVAALARSAGVHRVHLARAFRDHFGVAVTVYAQRLRVQVAHRLLSSSAMPLAEVAVHAGYADQSHMTRELRASLGMTPGALRRATLHPFKTALVSAR